MTFLDQIVPVVLTYNEAPNIGRCLAHLTWAREVTVLDSYSTDDTLEICARFPNVRVSQRIFDNHANQWNFALSEASKAATWILALDADYIVTAGFVKEVASLAPQDEIAGYRCCFRYAIFGRPLHSGIYPPGVALFRRARARYLQDGHTQRLVLDGKLESVMSRIFHDDRKPFDRWIQSQRTYASLECDKIVARGVAGNRLALKDWLRARTPFAPIVVAIYCLLVRGGIFDGYAGVYYALQRMAAEALVAAAIHDRVLRERRSELTSRDRKTG